MRLLFSCAKFFNLLIIILLLWSKFIFASSFAPFLSSMYSGHDYLIGGVVREGTPQEKSYHFPISKLDFLSKGTKGGFDWIQDIGEGVSIRVRHALAFRQKRGVMEDFDWGILNLRGNSQAPITLDIFSQNSITWNGFDTDFFLSKRFYNSYGSWLSIGIGVTGSYMFYDVHDNRTKDLFNNKSFEISGRVLTYSTRTLRRHFFLELGKKNDPMQASLFIRVYPSVSVYAEDNHVLRNKISINRSKGSGMEFGGSMRRYFLDQFFLELGTSFYVETTQGKQVQFQGSLNANGTDIDLKVDVFELKYSFQVGMIF